MAGGATTGRRELHPNRVVAGAAVAAGLLRFPGLLYPLGSDEAGFTLVARQWHPEPDSLYGAYWVDRPPSLIALIKLSDLVGGAYFIRFVAALGCVALVVLAAATARAALRYTGETDQRFIARTGAWTAVLAAAFTSTAMIDPIMAKGEILGIPWVLLSFYLSLRALTRERIDGAAYLLAAGAGLTAVVAQGMKQNLVAGLVFGAVLVAGARLTRRITRGQFLRLTAAAFAGAAVPVLATLGWTLAEGVRLHTLWYAVYGFRSDALEVIAGEGLDRPLMRGLLLVGVAVGSGAAFVLAGVVLHWRRIWRLDGTLAAATAAAILVDGLSLVAGGSFWRPYLFALVPDLVLCTALLLAVRQHVAARARVLVVTAAAVSVLATAIWTVVDIAGYAGSDAGQTGQALREAAETGDTIVAYGGRSELVLTSGMTSPYEHLWSLPMRTLDPSLQELRDVLSGPDPPTWVVMWVSASGWDENGESLRPILDRRYRPHGQTCGDHRVYLLAGENRPPLRLDCGPSAPFGLP